MSHEVPRGRRGSPCVSHVVPWCGSGKAVRLVTKSRGVEGRGPCGGHVEVGNVDVRKGVVV